MSRIIAGRGKGRRLATPKGLDTRPTGGRVKQTLFDILAPELPGCRFLDAFAGAGGIGLEALSRGASVVVLVDTSAAAVAAIKENLRALGDLGGSAQVFRQDARVALPALCERPLRAAPGRGGTPPRRGWSGGGRAFPQARPPGDNRALRPDPLGPGGRPPTHVLPGPRSGDASRLREEAGVNRRRDAVAIFPGSFDPITNGHLDIVTRGLSIFREVLIAILVNPDKRPLFTVEERVEIIRKVVRSRRVRVTTFSGLLVDYAEEVGASVIISGLRAISDFEYEFQMARRPRMITEAPTSSA